MSNNITREEISEAIFNDGVLSGHRIDWYRNGQKKEEGASTGLWTQWYENGEKKAHRF